MENREFSMELDKVQHYIDHVHGYLADLTKRNEHGQLVLSANEAATFAWMLAEAGNVIHELNIEDEGLKLAA